VVKDKYHVEVTDEFLDHLRLSSLRIGGGSGSFVSPNGLIFTTHHVAGDCLGKSDNGFSASMPARERKCPGMEATVLVALENVTAQVKGVARDEGGIAAMEKACSEKTGNHCVVVKLFSGERYDLYQYRRYTDLRLVFAPEFAIASFGGEQDQLTYPRYDLDIAFLRAYENGKPAATPQYLKWSADGVKDADLVFAAGSPGNMSRLATGAQLAFYRDTQLPLQLSRLSARISLLREYSARSEDARRAAQLTLFDLARSYKTLAGRLIALKDQRLMARKLAFERKLRKGVENDPKLGVDAGKAWDEIALAYKNWAPLEKAYELLERPAAQGSSLFRIARSLVRASEEPKYRDYEPIDDGVEIVLLTQYLEELKALGEKDAPVKTILQGRTSQAAAEAIVRDTKLKDAADRERLAGDAAAVARSTDPMIQLARLIDTPARRLRKRFEESIASLEGSSLKKIGQYRFQSMGSADYPDASFTPRISFGAVKGYRDKTEAPVPYATTFGGLYHRAGKEEPYRLPQRWRDAKSALDMITPFNFVSTCDTNAGNSGSPTVNARGEIVGIVFDTNIEALALTYQYSDEQARAVHVASQGILESLKKVYRVPELLQELGVGK
jgi:hypothetical protein